MIPAGCYRFARSAGVIAAALLFPALGRAIDPSRTMSQYVRERWGAEQGFPSGPVYAIDQTRDGYLWIGTEKGLVRFDGFNFHLMQSAAPAQASLSHVLGLFAHPDGSLWLRLRRPGMTLLRFRGGVFEDVMGDLATLASAAAMARGRDGGPLLWVLQREGNSVRGEGLAKLAPVEYSGSPVLALSQSANGDIWMGTRDAGLLRVRSGEATQITEGLSDLKVNALAPFGDGELWVGADRGVVRWDGTQITNAGVPEALRDVHALAMLVDHDGNLWVGTNAQGLARLNSSGVAWMEPSTGMASEAITALFEDREGNLWVGSARGLERIRDSVFVTYSATEGLPAEGVGPVYVDGEGHTWLAPLDGGLWRLKDGRPEQVTAAGLSSDIIYSIAGATDGVWIGRRQGGLTHLRLDGGAISTRTYAVRDGLAQNSVYAVHESRDGSAWAGTLSGGVSRLRDGQFTSYTSADGLATNTVASILESADGVMWFATPGGLSAFDDGKWRTYRAAEGLPSDDIHCLLEDSGGTLWAGSSSGLAFRSGDAFRVPAGLPVALRGPILGLAEDGDGSLWVSTANRLVRLTRATLLTGEFSEDALREFTVADGLRGVEGVKRHRSVVADASGRIWFSTNGGVSVVDPARLAALSAPAIAHIETVAADGRALDAQAPVVVPGGSRRIVFGYTGLSLAVPERVRFRYKLDDFDSAWSEPVETREAVYTNLSPGSYRFRVAASNVDGAWSDSEGSISFEVAPLFWQTSWFRLAGALALCFAMAGVYRLRMHQLTRQLNLRFEERLAERTRVAQELHDTLLQGFLSASMQLHVAAERLPDESPAKPPLNRVMSLMSEVIDEGRRAVQGLRSSGNESLDLEQALCRVPRELSMDDGVNLRVIASGPPKALHPVLRDEVYRIGREAVVNALRHANATSIEVEVEYAPRDLRVLVRDDGRGISPEVLQSGRAGHWGLTGMRERAERVGGRLSVWSKVAEGTEVELLIPGRLAYRSPSGQQAGGWLSRWMPRRPQGQAPDSHDWKHK